MAPIVAALVLAIALRVTNALTVLAPTAGEQVNLSDVFTIRWQRESNENPVLLSIDLVNATAATSTAILLNIARNVSSTAGDVNVTWPLSVPNSTAAYQLYFLSTAAGTDLATSGVFNLTLPHGETRTVPETGTGPVNPAAGLQAFGKTQRLSGGAIAGIVVGVLVALLCALLAAWLSWRMKRKRIRTPQSNNEKLDKPELDGSESASGRFHKRSNTVDTDLSAELESSQDHKERIDLHEMAGDANWLRFELPVTPPPAELEVNEPAVEEMYASPTMTARPGSVLAEPRAPSVNSSGRTLDGSRTFAEALHDLVSEELRRDI